MCVCVCVCVYLLIELLCNAHGPLQMKRVSLGRSVDVCQLDDHLQNQQPVRLHCPVHAGGVIIIHLPHSHHHSPATPSSFTCHTVIIHLPHHHHSPATPSSSFTCHTIIIHLPHRRHHSPATPSSSFICHTVIIHLPHRHHSPATPSSSFTCHTIIIIHLPHSHHHSPATHIHIPQLNSAQRQNPWRSKGQSGVLN